MSRPDRRRIIGGFPLRALCTGWAGRAPLGLAAVLATLSLGATAAAAAPPLDHARVERPAPVSAAEPGAFCSPSACRPAAASPWTAAAFGATALAIGWRARRRGTSDR